MSQNTENEQNDVIDGDEALQSTEETAQPEVQSETHPDDQSEVTSDVQEEASEITIESLQEALAAAELKVKDEALRGQAEIQNVRKRSERDVANAHKFGQEKLVKELLAVVDSLERGIQTVDEQEGELDPAVKTIRDGSDLTLKMLMSVFEKYQIKQLNPEGEPFDPQYHEAISMIESPDAEPNSVISVVQKGYTLSDRLMRPAMVVVAKS